MLTLKLSEASYNKIRSLYKLGCDYEAVYDTGGWDHSEQCNILLQFPASFVGSFQSSRAGSENPTFLPPDVRQHQPPQFSHNIIIAINRTVS